MKAETIVKTIIKKKGLVAKKSFIEKLEFSLASKAMEEGMTEVESLETATEIIYLMVRNYVRKNKLTKGNENNKIAEILGMQKDTYIANI